MTVSPEHVAPGPSTVEVTRDQVTDFLYLEAELLDDWRLDEWLDLYTADASYVIPCNDDPDGDPSASLVLIDDNRVRMESRVDRLNNRRAHREYPHSNVRHLVTNIRIGDRYGDELAVRASFVVWRFRNGTEKHYVGQYHYRLVLGEPGLHIRSKRVVLDMTTLRPASDVALFL
jgi:p-cumate 2,3-dioxygenase beta subunit